VRSKLPFRQPLLVALASVCTLLSACGSPPGGPPPAEGTPVMGVMTLQTQPVTLTTALPGRTVPYMIAEVRPQVGGILLKRTFEEGGMVKAGQQLYQIDPAPYQATLARSEASLESAKLLSQRYDQLIKGQIISQQDRDDARSEYLQAKASAETARIDLGYTRITSPITGRIGRSLVTQGALLTANQSDALATVQQLDPIYVDVTQPSASMLRLRRALQNGELEKVENGAAKVQLTLEDGSVYPLEGQLELSEVTVDQATGAITMRAVFPNPNAELLPGMYVHAVLQEGVNRQALLVPQRAVQRNGAGKPTAFVVGGDNKLQLRILETDRAIGDQWLVRSGLKAGDVLVVEGLPRARDGIEVKTAPWQPGAQPAVAAQASAIGSH
jgi:membrane fusion protein (multidrug efflux system)